MITWIQTVLQKHHKSVFGVLLVAIIIAFVFTIGSVPFFGDSHSSGSRKGKVFYGFDLSNDAVVAQLQNCVYFELIFAGQQPQSEAQFTQLVLRQAYLRSLANELGMTTVSQDELDRYISSSPLFADKDGKFSHELFANFVKSRRINEEVLSEILSQNALVNKVANLLGGPGYMPKFEIERQYAQRFGTWDFNLAVLSADSLKLDIKPTPEVLEKYFKDNAEAYRIGEGVVVETVFFPAKNFSVEPTEQEISAHFAANAGKYATTDKDGKQQMPKLSDVKGKVKADAAKAGSLRKAAQAAEEFVLKIYDAEAKKASAELKKIAQDFKVEFKKNAPIRITDVSLPEGFPVEAAGAAMKLDDSRFYSDPVATGDGAYVVFFVEKLPSYLPKFADVKEKVLRNYTDSEKARLFAERANTLDKALAKAVSEKKSFASVARAGGAKVESVKNFSFLNPQGDAVLQAYSVISSTLPSMKVGAVSSAKTFGEKSYIIELVKFTPPTDKDAAAKIETIGRDMERAFGAVSSMSVISEKMRAGEKRISDEEK